jgi:GT2 family glycosyltransferase
MIDTTLIISAYKPAGLLQKCLNSIIQYTDLDRVKILAVCNGSDKESADYLISLNHSNINFIWYTDPLGYTVATNIGIKHAQTPYLLLLNTDTFITDHPKHGWVQEIINPLKADSNLAVTGITPAWAHGWLYFPFACVGINKHIMEKMSYLDEIFSPGYGEDIDYCIRVVKAGYTIKLVANVVVDDSVKYNFTNFPVCHDGGQSYKEKSWEYLQRARKIIDERHFNIR